MTLLDKINKQIIACYKNGEADKRILLQTIKAELIKLAKDKTNPSQDEQIHILRREVKARQEALNQFTAAKRDDLADKAKREVREIQKFLPEEIGETEVRTIVREAIRAAKDANFGGIMGAVMPKLKGRANGALVAKTVQDELKKMGRE